MKDNLHFIVGGIIVVVVFVLGTQEALEALLRDDPPEDLVIDRWIAIEFVGKQVGVGFVAGLLAFTAGSAIKSLVGRD